MRNKIKNQSGCLSEILEVKNSSITYKRNTKKSHTEYGIVKKEI
jgi:hypothetical protein